MVNVKSGFFLHFADRAHLRRLTRFKFTAQSIPLSLVDVVQLFYPMDHQGLSIPPKIAQSSEFHK
jgi:hypothetical protein